MTNPARSCGGLGDFCGECCFTDDVWGGGMRKPGFTHCALWSRVRGCSIHENGEKPTGCKERTCAHTEGDADFAQRPDALGAVPTWIYPQDGARFLQLSEGERGDLDSPLIRSLVATFLSRGTLVFLVYKRMRRGNIAFARLLVPPGATVPPSILARHEGAITEKKLFTICSASPEAYAF